MSDTTESQGPHGDDLQMLTADEITSLLQISKRMLLQWRSNGEFPPPDLEIRNTKRWLKTTVRDWIEGNRKSRGL